MKRIIIFATFLLFVLSGYAQKEIPHDDGPLVDPRYEHLKYDVSGAKWNKTNLTYYIDNRSTHLTASERESAIRTAFRKWAEISTLTFTQVYSPSNADLKIKWGTADHGCGHAFGSGILLMLIHLLL